MSETVKIIVTLSKGQYEALKDIQFGSIGSMLIFNAVKNGIPLDDVKKEIHKKSVWIHGFNYVAPHKIDEILDNIGKESEDKE